MNKRAKKLSIGLHGLASILDEMSYRLLSSKPPAPTAAGNVRAAAMQLKTSFAGSLKCTKAVTPNPKHRLPTAILPTESSSVSPSNGVVITPSVNTPCDSNRSSARIASRVVDAGTLLEDDRDAQSLRLDVIHRNQSSTYNGMKRLSNLEILSLRRTHEFTLVVPHVDRKVIPAARVARTEIQGAFDAITKACSISSSDKDAIASFVERERNERTIFRESKACVEYNVRIRAFAERDKIHTEIMTPSQIQYMIGPGGNGIVLELIGYGDAITVLLKFSQIPYIEVFVSREKEASFTDPCYDFSRTKDDSTFLNELQQQLHARKGDPIAYVQILMNYYKKQLALTKGRDVNLKVAATSCANELDVDKLVRSAIDAEMERGDTIALANSIDSDYEKAICERFSTFGYAREYLISKEKITQYYQMLKSIFKHLHYAIATLISTRYYSIDVSVPPEDDENEEMGEMEELHYKERIIVFLCLGMIRAKSNRLLKHYAMIEPFAYFSKGLQQPGRQSLSGSLSSTLRTSMKNIKEIYDRCLPTFNDQLSGTMRCHGAFDNHQQFLPKKNPETENQQCATSVQYIVLS